MPWACMVAFRGLGTWAWLTATQIILSLQICMQGWITMSVTSESLSSDGQAHDRKCTENHDADACSLSFSHCRFSESTKAVGWIQFDQIPEWGKLESSWSWSCLSLPSVLCCPSDLGTTAESSSSSEHPDAVRPQGLCVTGPGWAPWGGRLDGAPASLQLLPFPGVPWRLVTCSCMTPATRPSFLCVLTLSSSLWECLTLCLNFPIL